jgi:hypothetical protein
VVDRIQSEILPIFDLYDVAMVKDNDLCALNNFVVLK